MRQDTKTDLSTLIGTLDNIDDLKEVKELVMMRIESLGR